MRAFVAAAASKSLFATRCVSGFRPIFSFFAPPALIVHRETRVTPFRVSQIQGVAVDVPNYAKFLPYCKKSEIVPLKSNKLSADEGRFVARLALGCMGFHIDYLSNVSYHPGHVKITRNEKDTLFKELECTWDFKALGDGERSKLDYKIQFQLANPLFNATAKTLTDFFACKMNEAFISRAYELYGKKKSAEPAHCVAQSGVLCSSCAVPENICR